MTNILLSQLKLTEECKEALRGADIHTLGDLMTASEEELKRMSVIHFSEVHVLRMIMTQYIMQVPESPQIVEDDTQEVTLLTSIPRFKKLSSSARDGLNEMKVRSVEQLIELTGTDMMRTNLMDIKTIDEILKFKLKYQNGQLDEPTKQSERSIGQPILSRMEIVEYLVDKHGQIGLDFDELMTLYGQYLQLHQLEFRKVGNKQSFIKVVSESKKIVKSEHKLFRAYHFKEYDWVKFYDALKLEDYNNQIISTAILFATHPDVMNDYDIRNKDELHNIIRKTVDELSDNVEMMKLPMLCIGEAERELQLVNFVQQHAPLTQKELFKKYKETYGISESSIRVNDELKAIDQYYDGEHYQSTPHEDKEADGQILSRLLKKQNIIFLDELKEQYFNRTNTPLLLTKYQTQQYGYRLYNEFLLPIKYKNANDFFNKRIFNKPVVDLNTIDKRTVRLQVFQTYLNEFLTSKLYIEVADKVYVALKVLRSKGINKAYIRTFEKSLVEQIPSDKIIAINEVTDRIDDNLFKLNHWDEKAYYTILRGAKGVQTRRVGGATLARKSSIPFNFGDFIVQVIDTMGTMTVDELMAQLKEYTLELPKQRIIDTIEANEILMLDELEMITKEG